MGALKDEIRSAQMKLSSIIAAAVVAVGMAAAAAPSEAAQLSHGTRIQSQNFEPIHYRHWRGYGFYGERQLNSCRYWRHECAERWDWGSWRFRRCLIRHGC